LNEESGTGSGALVKTYIGGMAEIAGSNPATGAYSYYMRDNLGSTRAVYNQAEVSVAGFDYTPYGQASAAHDTVDVTHRYTGHDWDATANLYFAPYRFYNPQLARWMTRDPLGMVDGPNVYAYVRSQPTQLIDPLGTNPTLREFKDCILDELDEVRAYYWFILGAITAACGIICTITGGIACAACIATSLVWLACPVINAVMTCAAKPDDVSCDQIDVNLCPITGN
jgi:RHS repeat-associated protein